MRYLALLSLLVILIGCVASRYTHEGKKSFQIEKESLLCEDKLLKEHEQLRNITAAERQALMDDCMKEKGYAVKK